MITDELRKYVDGREGMGVSPLMRRTFTAIADRIDAEHERDKAESIINMTDESMAEHGFVRLPKDADDEYVHIGDVMYDCGESPNRNFSVVTVEL